MRWTATAPSAWLRAGLDGALLLMEITWLSVAGTLLAILLGADGSPVPLWLALAVGTLGLLSTRIFSPETIPLSVGRVLMAGLGLLVLYLAVALLPGMGFDLAWPRRLAEGWLIVRHAVVGGLLVLAFWWSGSHVGQSDAPTQTLHLSFRIGVVVVVVGAIAHVVLPVHVGATAAVFLFFGAGIAAFALGHIISMAPEESAGLRDWPRVAGITVGGIVLGSILLALVTGGELGHYVALWVRLLGRVAMPVVAAVAWLIGLAAEALTYAVLAIVHFFRDNPEPVRFRLTTPNFSNVRPAEGGASFLPGWLLWGLGWGAVLLAGAGLAYLLWRSLALRPRSQALPAEEEREKLEGEGTLGEDLAAALGSLLGRVMSRRSKEPSPLAMLDPTDPRAPALGAYYSLLAYAAYQGLERQTWQTPQEFESELASVRPPEEVASLTQAFERARYGSIPPSEAEAARLRAAWTALQGALAGGRT